MNRSRGFLETSCRGEKRSICVTVVVLGIIIGCILLAYQAFASPINKKPTLRQVVMIFRHGDRNPTETYANDPYLNYSWPNGMGALTKIGMEQMYKLGKWLHEEYEGFIDNPYRTMTTLIRSSNADRCIMSAQVLLAGLYPPSEEDMFVPELKWHPVPIHSIPREMDTLIVAKKKCPRLDEALIQAKLNESKHQDVEYYLNALPALAGQDFSTIVDIEFLYNTLEIEEKRELKLPDWTKEFYNATMREIAARSLAMFTSNTLQQRLRGGPLLKEILDRMKDDEKSRLKTYLYSAHDTTLVNTLRTMGFTNELFKPDYGATLIFELHSIITGQSEEVKVLYINNTESIIPHSIAIPKCATPCSLEDLTQAWKDVLPIDFDKECQL